LSVGSQVISYFAVVVAVAVVVVVVVGAVRHHRVSMCCALEGLQFAGNPQECMENRRTTRSLPNSAFTWSRYRTVCPPVEVVPSLA